MSRLRVTPASSSATTGSSWRGGSVVVASFDWNSATLRSPVAHRAAGEGRVGLGGGAEGAEHRLVAGVDVGVAARPRPAAPTQPAASGVSGSSASADARSWRATWPARWRNTSSLPEKYW